MKFSAQNPVKSLHLVSLGCTKNLVDSEIMLGKLKDYKISDDATNADVLIVNTCGFIDSAKEESINTILDLHDQRKEESVLVVAGCLTQRYQEELQKEIPEVDIFTGVGDYDRIDELVDQKRSAFTNQVFLASDTNERVITGSSYHAYVKLSEGCNQTCSFCAIPSFKGKLHSRTLQSLVKEVSSLVSKGYTDFTFISQDSSSFLRDQGQKDGLEQLINEVDKIESLIQPNTKILYAETPTNPAVDIIDLELEKIISQILHYENIVIEVIGSWIWLSGDTKQIKDTLKEIGFKWARTKKLWFYGEMKRRNPKEQNIEDIKAKYGCQTVKTKQQRKISI